MTMYSTRASRWAEVYKQKLCKKHHFFYRTVCLRCKAEKDKKDKEWELLNDVKNVKEVIEWREKNE